MGINVDFLFKYPTLSSVKNLKLKIEEPVFMIMKQYYSEAEIPTRSRKMRMEKA